MSNMVHYSKEIIGKDFGLSHEAGKGTTTLCHIPATRPKIYQMSHKVKVKTKTNIKKFNHTHEESSRYVLVENENI